MIAHHNPKEKHEKIPQTHPRYLSLQRSRASHTIIIGNIKGSLRGAEGTIFVRFDDCSLDGRFLALEIYRGTN